MFQQLLVYLFGLHIFHKNLVDTENSSFSFPAISHWHQTIQWVGYCWRLVKIAAKWQINSPIQCCRPTLTTQPCMHSARVIQWVFCWNTMPKKEHSCSRAWTVLTVQSTHTHTHTPSVFEWGLCCDLKVSSDTGSPVVVCCLNSDLCL